MRKRDKKEKIRRVQKAEFLASDWQARRTYEEKWGQNVVLSPLHFIVRGYDRLSCAHRPALLEAFAAKHRTPLCRPERHSGLLTTLRTIGFCFRAHLQSAGNTWTSTLGASCFAPFTSLRFVFEALVGEKHLLAGSKYKLGAALRTLQDPIVIFHERRSP